MGVNCHNNRTRKRQQNHSIKSITFYIVNRSINWYEYATTQKFRWRFGVEDHKIPFNYAWAAGECVTHTHYIHTETRETPHDAHILNTNNMIHCGTYWRLFCFFAFYLFFFLRFCLFRFILFPFNEKHHVLMIEIPICALFASKFYLHMLLATRHTNSLWMPIYIVYAMCKQLLWCDERVRRARRCQKGKQN